MIITPQVNNMVKGDIIVDSYGRLWTVHLIETPSKHLPHPTRIYLMDVCLIRPVGALGLFWVTIFEEGGEIKFLDPERTGALENFGQESHIERFESDIEENRIMIKWNETIYFLPLEAYGAEYIVLPVECGRTLLRVSKWSQTKYPPEPEDMSELKVRYAKVLGHCW